MLGVALLIMPTVAWIDYRQGFQFSAMVELAAATSLFGLIFHIRPLGVRRAIRLTLVVMFALAVLGSIEKLGSTPNLVWFTVMPFLYIYIGGIRLGGLLTMSHFLIIAGCYLSFAQPVIAAEYTGTWLQVGLAYFTAAALAVSYEHMQRGLRQRLRALADHDPLTGRVNDEYGHDAGDAVLREISQELQRICRGSDYLARWGGEEFLVALTQTDIDGATERLERLRSQIAELRVFSVPSVTLSMGAAEWRPDTDLDTALKQADAALYEAKEKGRNRLVAATEDTPRTLELASTAGFR